MTTELIDTQTRFAFGKNWKSFATQLNQIRIEQAKVSLLQALERPDLHNTSFLDIGSGSGLFSLAARSLGATVHSFDYDTDSVECTRSLKQRFFHDDQHWTIDKGSILDAEYVRSLGTFDIVYSWGVLHHTGDMWRALENAAMPVKSPNGQLFIAIYNDQGTRSIRWKKIKRVYCRSNKTAKYLILAVASIPLWGPTLLKDCLLLHPTRSWRNYIQMRGMAPWHDIVDWVGGYPFEVAKPEEIFSFYTQRDFTLTHLTTCGGTIGNNEFVFRKQSPNP